VADEKNFDHINSSFLFGNIVAQQERKCNKSLPCVKGDFAKHKKAAVIAFAMTAAGLAIQPL